MNKLKLRRHESFPLREGWIEKGICAFNKHKEQIFSKENGSKYLGIGSNMVKSLKYWMVASYILEDKAKTKYTEFGKILSTYDPYMEKKTSWWLVHFYLVSNFNQSPVLYYIHNIYDGSHIDKDVLKQEIIIFFKENGFNFNEKLVNEDVNMYLRLYFNEDKQLNPEDNLSSPLAKLDLLGKSIDRKYYVKKSANLDNLNCYVVLYVLQKIYKDNFEINDVKSVENSPLNIFNINKGLFEQYIIQLRNLGLITVNKTAGLNTVYFNKIISLEELYTIYMEDEHAL